jgi:hypothetical protein
MANRQFLRLPPKTKKKCVKNVAKFSPPTPKSFSPIIWGNFLKNYTCFFGVENLQKIAPKGIF